MSDPVIQARALRKTFGKRNVLDALSFDVHPGEVVGVLGKNGAGKTTLLEIMLGFSPPTAGHMRILGHESGSLPAVVKRRMGFVPQQDELLDQLTAAEQLRLIASFYPGWDDDLVTRLCAEWSVNPQARIKNLSVGERQKLSILMAFGHRPDLLILDEPVASLDPLARRQFLEQLVELSGEGDRTVIFSSHIVSDIERLASRVWILKEGRLCWEGDLASLKESILRIHVRPLDHALPALDIPGLITQRANDRSLTAVVHDWTPETEREFQERYRVAVDSEVLGLEDIFLELHR